MLSVASLLNPVPPTGNNNGSQTRPASTLSSKGYKIGSPVPKKMKLSKSAAVFNKAEPKGIIRYKPFEGQDGAIAAEHRKFQVQPVGRITEYPRHIPYRSDKKNFQEKTGRDAFEGKMRPAPCEQQTDRNSLSIHISHA